MFGEPPEAGRPIGLVDPASRARVDGGFVETLAQPLDLAGAARVAPRKNRGDGPSLPVNADEAVPDGAHRHGIDGRLDPVERAVDRLRHGPFDRRRSRLDATVAAGPPAVADPRALTDGLEAGAVEGGANRRGSDVDRQYARHERILSHRQPWRIISAMLPPGTIVDGRYEIVEALAEGGMGSVFRARRRLLEDEVAIKIVRSDIGADAGARERFLREGRACAQLRHPNIVSILDYNLDAEGRPFLVMELLNGRSLRQEIVLRGPLPLEEVQAMIQPLCSALQLAHGQGILHRDLKPANIVAHDFGGGTRVHKIVDFGLVRVQASESPRLTQAHQFVGTLTYASPEQIFGGEVDARLDRYSLAVVAYELLAGRAPFVEHDPARLVNALMTKTFPAPSALRPDLPKWIDVVLGRALAKSPSDRYGSVDQFGRALQAGSASDRSTVVTRPTPAASGGLLATYELGERLGPGRLGSEVFRGTHRALGHPVAIRLLRRSADRNWDAVRGRFLREAQTLQVAHQSIIQVRDYGEEGDLVYLVTDFLDGPSLRVVLQTDGALAWPRLKPLLAQLIEAARVLHRKGGLLCGLTPTSCASRRTKMASA